MRYLLILLLAAAFCVCGAEMTLVRNGQPNAVILLNPEKNTRSAQLGALELQHHVKKITGATLPIVTAPQNGKISIQIGGENAGMKSDSLKIRFSKDRILLTGNDKQDFGKVDYSKPDTFPKAELASNGSLFAVYDFLEDYCGVRFLYMSDSSTVVKKHNTLTVNGKDKDFASPMEAFRWVYVDDHEVFKKVISERDNALWRLRWRMCDFYGRVNHTQYSIYFAHYAPAKRERLAAAFKEKREDLFAQGFKGKSHGVDYILQVNYPNDPDIPPQLCYSNPDTVSYYANEVLTYAKGRNVIGGWRNFWGDYPVTETRLPRFDGMPFFYPIEGGDTGGHCLCDNCKKRFPDMSAENVSNNKFQFIADVARKAAETDPTAGVASLAYIHSLSYPERVNLPANVSVQICLPIYSWWHPVAYSKQHGEYRKWIDKESKKRPLTLWTYIFCPHWDAQYHFGNYKPFLGVYPWKTAEYFKMFAQDGIRGWFTEVEMKYNALEAYIAARLCYNPALDTEKLIDDYFSAAYGSAAPYIKEFYKELEKAYWNPAIPADWLKDPNVLRGPKGAKHDYWSTGLWSPELNWGTATPERMKKLSKLLAEAKKRVKTDTEKQYFNRLASLWKETLAGQEAFKRLQASKNAPVRSLAVNEQQNVNGDFNKVDWSKGAVTAPWVYLMGDKSNSRCSVKAVADKEYLYLEFIDRDGADVKAAGQDDFEIFMPVKGGFPMYQICVSPKGEITQLKHDMKHDNNSSSSFDFNLKSYNKVKNGVWTVRLAIPRKKLPFADNTLLINFFRTQKSGHGQHKAWSPIFTGRYLQGADRAGRIVIFPLVIQESEFYKYNKGRNTAETIDSASDNGRTVWSDGKEGWALQCKVNDKFPAGRYKVSARMRMELKSAGDASCVVGIFDRKSKKTMLQKTISSKKYAGKKYKTVDLGVCDIREGSTFYLGAFSPKSTEGRIYVDSLLFSAPDKQ